MVIRMACSTSWPAPAGTPTVSGTISATTSWLTSATPGILVIDETGEVLDVLDVDQRGVLTGAVRPAHGTWTLVVAWGNWLPPTALAGACILLALAARRGRVGGNLEHPDG